MQKPEQVTADNCSSCKASSTTKEVHLVNLPQILSIHLDRFKNNDMRTIAMTNVLKSNQLGKGLCPNCKYVLKSSIDLVGSDRSSAKYVTTYHKLTVETTTTMKSNNRVEETISKKTKMSGTVSATAKEKKTDTKSMKSGGTSK